MIKINLLSQLRAKKVKKQAEIQYQLWLFGGFLVLAVVVLGYLWFYLNDRITNLQTERIAMDQTLNQLKVKVKEVENFEKDKKNFEEKINVIQQLKFNQSGPVHLLDEVSRNLPARVWLVALTQNNRNVSIEGKAITNSEIVDFIDNLKKTQFFSNIELLESRQATEGNVPIYNFKLSATMAVGSG
jgi:type IV pilus assembly protein PilN